MILLDFIENSSILIVNNIEETLNLMLPKYPLHSVRVIKNDEKEEFFTVINKAQV